VNADGATTLDGSVRREKRFSPSTLAMAGVVVVVVCGVLVYMVTKAQHAVNETLCHSNLVKLHHALLSYDAKHGSLPSAVLNGPDGNPIHSWRVLILPYLDAWGIDGKTIYQSYDMSKPWNDFENRKLFQPVPESRFACPCGPEKRTTLTSYVVLVGEGTLFPSNQTVSASDIPNTVDPILVLEITNSDVEWSEPRDLQIDELAGRDAANSLELARPHAGTIRYITLRGKLGVLPADTSLDAVRRLASTDGQPANGAEELP